MNISVEALSSLLNLLSWFVLGLYTNWGNKGLQRFWRGYTIGKQMIKCNVLFCAPRILSPHQPTSGQQQTVQEP